MAYKVQTQRILPGGLNLLAPGDQGTEGDCLDLKGYWPQGAGRVEVMPGPSLVAGSATMDAVCDFGGTPYSGGGGNLYRNGGVIDSGYDASYPLGMLPYQGFLWVINAAKQSKDDGTTVTDWTPAACGPPTMTSGAGGAQFALPYWYYCTAQTPVGESNPSAATSHTPAADNSVIHIAQPASIPAGATGWNIYRLVGGTPYLLNKDPIPIATTSYDDYGDEAHNQTDTDLLDLGIIMEADHDPAPAARIMANQVFNGRIVVANSAAHPNRIWYTPALQPGFFRGSANPFDGDWVDCGTDSRDEVLAMTVRPNMVLIYRSKSIWRQTGDFGDDNSRLDCVVPDTGILGPHAVVQTSLGDYFRGPENICHFNTDWAQGVGAKVSPLFKSGQTPENFDAESDESKCALGFENGRLWVSYHGFTYTSSLIYHIQTDRWYNSSHGFNAFSPSADGLLGASSGVYLAVGSSGVNDMAFQSQYQDCGLPDHEKTYGDLVINHLTAGISWTIEARINKGAQTITVATIRSFVLTKQIIPLVWPSAGYTGTELAPIRAFNISIRITGDDTPIGAGIDGPILLHYYLEARGAQSFDSAIMDHGIQGVKQLDQLEFDMDTTAGAATLQVYSDIPGGVVVPRLTPVTGIAATSGRESIRVVLGSPIDGKLLQYRAATDQNFLIYGIRARLLPIGVYLDGTVGDFWQPQPISIGV